VVFDINYVFEESCFNYWRSSRLRPFTFSRPKHLIPLLGKPMIQYVIDDLINSDVRDVLGYSSAQVLG